MLLASELCNDFTNHSEQLKKNGRILYLIVGVVCSLAEQEFAFRGHDGSSIAVNRLHCEEFLNLLKNNGHLHENRVNSATVI